MGNTKGGCCRCVVRAVGLLLPTADCLLPTAGRWPLTPSFPRRRGRSPFGLTGDPACAIIRRALRRMIAESA